MKIMLNVEGMHCKSCVMLVKDALEEKGAKNVNVKLDGKTKKAIVSCEYEGDKIDIINTIKKEGYKVLK